MASAGTGSSTAVWCYPIIIGLGLGFSLTCLVTIAQLSTPPALIAITSGLLIAIRSLGGAVGLAICKLHPSSFPTYLEDSPNPQHLCDQAFPPSLPTRCLNQNLANPPPPTRLLNLQHRHCQKAPRLHRQRRRPPRPPPLLSRRLHHRPISQRPSRPHESPWHLPPDHRRRRPRPPRSLRQVAARSVDLCCCTLSRCRFV